MTYLIKFPLPPILKDEGGGMKDERKQSVLHPSSFISHPFKKGVINPLSTRVYRVVGKD